MIGSHVPTVLFVFSKFRKQNCSSFSYALCLIFRDPNQINYQIFEFGKLLREAVDKSCHASCGVNESSPILWSWLLGLSEQEFGFLDVSCQDSIGEFMLIEENLSEPRRFAKWVQSSKSIHLKLAGVSSIHKQKCLENGMLHFGELSISFRLSQELWENIEAPFKDRLLLRLWSFASFYDLLKDRDKIWVEKSLLPRFFDRNIDKYSQLPVD